MRTPRKPVVLLVPILVLAACGSEKSLPKGEVYESVSGKQRIPRCWSQARGFSG
jgi:hypothetical protein